MNIFIIGPEGAGKTVFATMLNEYITQHPEKGLFFKAADFYTKKYLADELNLLKQGDWPASTKGGKMISLNWKWDMGGGKVSNISLIDPAGQDIRQELCGGKNTLQIINNIKQADLIILLVDLYGHMKESNDKKEENGWIVEHVLDNITEQQNVIFAITKADMLTGSLPRSQWEDRNSVLALVASMMPEFNIAAYRPILTNDRKCSVMAFSSLATTDNRICEGSLIRFPKSPLASEGINVVVGNIISAWKDKVILNKPDENNKGEINKDFFKIAGIVFSILFFVVILKGCFTSPPSPPEPPLLKCSACEGSGKVQAFYKCSICGGDGKVNDDDWIPLNDKKCLECNGLGIVSIENPCTQCNGKGYISQ